MIFKKKKVELNEDFYKNEIGVLDWLYDENQYQKIRLEREGCYHHKFNNQLHRVDGTAVEYLDGRSSDKFFLHGRKVTWEEHTNNKRGEVLDKTIGPQKENPQTSSEGSLMVSQHDYDDII